MSAVRTLALGVLVWLTALPTIEAAALGNPNPNSGNLRGFLRWVVLPNGNADAGAAQPAPVPAFAPPSAPSPTPAPVSTSAMTAGTARLFGTVGTTNVVANTVAAPAAMFAPPSTTPPPPVVAAPPAYQYDARIDLGSGPFAQQGQLTGGSTPQAWYLSPAAVQAFHGVPDAQQRADFSNAVVQRVEQIYSASGLPMTVTTNPNASAAHTLSVVSGTSYPANPDAVGITDVGNNGFSFIDKLGYAQDWQTLAKAVGANIAHELMHAFGGEHHDTTGQYLDSAVTPWSTMTADNLTFSSDAVQDLRAKDFLAVGQGVYDRDGQVIVPPVQPVPEPATIAVWAMLAGAVVVGRVRHARRRAA